MQYIKNLFTCSVLPSKNAELQEGEEPEVPQFSKGNYQFNWIGIYVITVPAFFVLLGLYLRVPLSVPILMWIAFCGGATGLVGITTGYHRLFSHGSYTASSSMQWVCAFLGAGAFQGSIKWWARNHRIHHKHTDTYKDPYDARRGFWFSHCGWFMMRMDYELLGDADVSDLKSNLVVDFQRKYFAIIAAMTGIILPCMMAGATTGEWMPAFFWVVWLKIFIVHQFSFFINSLAHMDIFEAVQPYSDSTTPRDSFICALVTFGEGYHNFHHQFPGDYRNGYKLQHFDITKWYIATLNFLGYCDKLQRTPHDVIHRAAAVQGLKTYERLIAEDKEEAHRLDRPVVDEFTTDDVKQAVQCGRKLIIIDGYVLDLEKPIPVDPANRESGEHLDWISSHPGGSAILKAFVGRDATAAFNGGVYAHTVGAHHFLPELRVGRMKVAEVDTAPSTTLPKNPISAPSLGR